MMDGVQFHCVLVDSSRHIPYADEYTEYEIETEHSESETLDFCRKELLPCSKSIDDERFFCDDYYEFRKIGENRYRYRVTTPNCD